LAKEEGREEGAKLQPGTARADLTEEEIRLLINELSQRLASSRKAALLYLYYPGATLMSKEDVIKVYNLFRNNGPINNLAVFLHSGGGDIAAAYDIINLCRKYTRGKISALVPQWAMSAATLIALGADELVPSKIGKLGPLDPVTRHPELGWLPVRAITDVPRVLSEEIHEFKGKGGELPPERLISLKADAIIKPMAEQADPYLHAAFAKTASVARMYGEKVFAAKKVSRERAGKCLEHLITVYPIHGYELDANELHENPVFRDVVKIASPSRADEDCMMDLLMAFLLLDQRRRQRGDPLRSRLIDLVTSRRPHERHRSAKTSPN